MKECSTYLHPILFLLMGSLFLYTGCDSSSESKNSKMETENQQETEENYKQQGRKLTQLLLTRQTDSLKAQMSELLIEDKAGQKDIQSWINENTGSIDDRKITVDTASAASGVTFERAYREGNEIYYCQIRKVPSDSSKRKVIRWRWENGENKTVNDAKISDVTKAAITKHSDYEFKTSLRLPFRGQWYTSWGGRHVCENYHVVLPYGNRFAYDFVVLKNGKKYQGDGSKNEDYYCFGKDILAPAQGQIVTAIDSVKDNKTLGEFDAKIPNYVIIDHGNNEYSFLGHLKYDSVPVKKGEQVNRGQKIGECGNSGTSGGPHLHYQVQSKPVLERDAKGLPAPFVEYYTDNEYIQRGFPKRGQYVRNKSQE